MLVALAFVIGIPAGAHFGAQRAIVPELLGENTADVARANAVFQTACRTTYFAGPAVGGVLLAAAGAPAVMLVDAATFAVSFVLVATLVPPAPAAEGAGESGGGGQPGARARLGGGRGLSLRAGVVGPDPVAQ